MNPLVTADNPKATLVQRMIGLEQNRHYVRVEQEEAHFGCVVTC
jgi:hypothetical protein